MNQSFQDRLRSAQSHCGSVLCVGLDPDPQRLPAHLQTSSSIEEALVSFCQCIIEATSAYACAFKLNLAFFEIHGVAGWRALERTIAAIPKNLITIADAKRGDIGNSARFYAASAFEHLGCDACTVAPYMGQDAVAPFLQYPGKAAFVLGRTSNPGARHFQEGEMDGEPLYLRVGKHVAAWSEESPGTGGLVVGATDQAALVALREACPTLPFLIPGVGAQGGDPAMVMTRAQTAEGAILVNSSRQILYASSGPDFAEAAAREAKTLAQTLALP